jgi:hypothetical protein
MTTQTTATAFDRAETARLLRDSAGVLESAARLVPSAFTHANPGAYPADAWTVAMNIAHMVVYEDQMANPVLAAMAKGSDGVGATKSDVESWFLADAEALAPRPLDELLRRLAVARHDAIAIVESFDESRWNAGITPLWTRRDATGVLRTPAWVAMKTFQHTWEHGNAVLSMALFAPR